MTQFNNIHVLPNECVVVNTRLIPRKLLFMLEKLAQFGYLRDVITVVFDTVGPDGYGKADKVIDGIKINLTKHVNEVMNDVRDDNEVQGVAINFMLKLWIELLDTIIHEAAHVRKEDPIMDDEPVRLQNHIDNGIITLAQNVDVEPPPLNEWGGMEKMITDTITEIHEHKTEVWAQKQIVLMKKGIVYEHETHGVVIDTARNFIRNIMAEGDTSLAWGEPLATFTFTQDEEAVDDIPEPEPPERAVSFLQPCVGEAGYGDEDTGYTPYIDFGDDGEDDMGSAIEQIPAAPQYQVAPQYQAPAPVAQVSMAPSVHHMSPEFQRAVQMRVNPPPVAAKRIVAPPVNLPPDVFARAMETFFFRMAECIFDKCGWNPAQVQPTGFTNPFNVYQGIYVADIEGLNQIVLSADRPDANHNIIKDQPIWETADPRDTGRIYGVVFKTSGLPAFRYYVNVNGTKELRSFIPQNIADQQKTGKNITRARNGERIAYLYNSDDKTKNAPLGSWENVAFRWWN